MPAPSITPGTPFAAQQFPSRVRLEFGAAPLGDPKGYADVDAARLDLAHVTGDAKPAAAIIANGGRLFGHTIDQRSTVMLDPTKNPASPYDLADHRPEPGDEPLKILFDDTSAAVVGIIDGAKFIQNEFAEL